MTDDTLNKAALTLLPAVWARMRLGAHIHSGDGELFFAVKANPTAYTDAFALFGYRLVEHPAKFYYLDGPDKDIGEPSRIAAILAVAFVLIDLAAASGLGFEQAFFPTPAVSRRFDELHLFQQQQHREVLAAAQIVDNDGVVGALRTMNRLGFARFEASSGSVSFLPPFHRLRDLCLALAEREEAGVTALAKDTAEQITAPDLDSAS
jgi:hypothetical protein